MWFPVSPSVTNLFMSHIENDFASAITPLVWLRYVDNIFVVSKKTFLRNFYELINTSSNIKVIFENEDKLSAIPSLIPLAKRNSNWNLHFTKYSKLTYSNRYIDYNSLYPFSAKISPTLILSSWALMIITSD